MQASNPLAEGGSSPAISAPTSHFEVVVIGAGMGGLCAAQKLRDYGFTPKVLEKAAEVGGTWRDNRYPGLHVDIPIDLYQLRFAPKFDWSRAYAPGSEIQEYLVRVADDYDLRRYVTFGVQVASAEWVEGRWLLTTTAGDTHTADAVVAGTGFLHRKRLPQITGMETFAGRWFHSSEWPDDLDIEGKRVAVIGSGSSGIQMVAELSTRRCQVVQYVRTPQWIETVKNPKARRLARLVGRLSPEAGRRLTTRLIRGVEQDPRLVDPRWKTEPGVRREGAQQALREDLEAIADPQLRAALTPDFPPGCKRIPKSPSYYQAVQQPNVRVVRRGVDQVCPDGIVAPDGTVEAYDVIVYATGFDAHAYVRPMRVTGLGGVTLDEAWSQGPFSYRGVAIPGFPNFFVLNGPFSPVNNVTVPKTLDDETGWICKVLSAAAERSCAFVPSEATTSEFVDWVSAALPRTVWWEGCDNWYRGNAKVPVIWPWLDKEQQQMFDDIALHRLDPVPCRLGAATK